MINKFDKILICLDLTEMDHFLINYANYIVKTFKPGRLIFIHVMEIYDIPDEIMDTFDDTERDIEDVIREELEMRIEQSLTVTGDVDYNLVMERGLTTDKIVEYSRKNKVDLSILGKKIGYRGQGSVSRKIVGLIPSSVLVVSETSPHKIEKLLVRMDFSKMAHSTLQMARIISEYTGAAIECHHVYKIPFHYYPRQTSENIRKLKEQVKQLIDKEYAKFIKKLKVSDAPPCTFSIETQSEESELLYHYAIKNSFDLILTGTRIKSPLANLILDSTSEKLVGGEKNLPVMVVKDQKKSVGILDAIFD